MRVVVASTDSEAAEWLRGVLQSAGLSVSVLADAGPDSPELDGADLLIADGDAARKIAGAGPRRKIMLVPRGGSVDVSEVLAGGYSDMLSMPAADEDILVRVGRVLDRFLKQAKTPPGMEAKAAELSAIVARVVDALKRSGPSERDRYHELAEDMLSVFVLLIDSHESTDRGTPGHSKRVGTLVSRVARLLGRTEAEASWLQLAGRLHDIGHLPMDSSFRTRDL